MPIEEIPTINFTFRNNRKVALPATVASLVRRLPKFWRGLRRLKAIVRESQPDVILNFFEALTGIYALTNRRRPPVIVFGHQFMLGHPQFVRAPGLRLQQLGMKWYVKLVGAASTRLALSFYEAQDLPRKNIKVCPPLLRKQIFEMHPNPDGKFVLVYLLNHGYAEQIIAWHMRNPQTAIHCFYDKPGAPAEWKLDNTLTFHRLDGDKFLRMMAECKQIACTAGFESLCEAAFMGKPLFLVPVENHVEQRLNALDATRLGWAVMDDRFNLDRLSELPERINNARFRAWLGRADSILMNTIEEAVTRAEEGSHHFKRWREQKSGAR
ncbi:MAG: UDP- glucuronosyltransferase [Verrucomicrobia bacterium]|nr:MAG: UDP- glucuronosyltransferase [Verrucomicrobiota bacterium]